MSTSLYAPDFLAVFNRYRDTGSPLQAFASPPDWRDQWIYFLVVDRFNNSLAPPRHLPFDDPKYYDLQGGNLASIQDQLPYINNSAQAQFGSVPFSRTFLFREEPITAMAFTIFCMLMPALPAILPMPTMSFAPW